MANDQDKGGDHTRSTDTHMGNAGQQGGHDSTKDMTERQKGGQHTDQRPDDRKNRSDTGKVGGQQREPDQDMHKER